MVNESRDVTVAIPCFNPDPGQLAEAIGSVARSTLQPAEVLLIDDGSTRPETLVALAAYAEAPGLRVIRHSENRGLAAARNTGMAEARTPLVLQLDADDLIDPTFLEKAVWALGCHPEWAFVNAWVVAFGAKTYTWRLGFERREDFLSENQTVSIALVRRAIDRAVGGHDESIRGGLEDWDYWLKMANAGHWGGTIPEPLIFYRQHPQPANWPNRNDAEKRARFRDELRRKYPRLWRDAFPKLVAPAPRPFDINEELARLRPAQTRTPTNRLRMLMVFPWLTLGGADRFNLNLTGEFVRRGHTVTIATTIASDDPWREAFVEHTNDIFSLPKFLLPEDQPRFLRHLIESRGIDVCLISNSMFGYSCLPYLRAACPETAFVDYTHMVATAWINGGFARIAHENQAQLDLNLVSSEQVKGWMAALGSDPERIVVARTGQDTAVFDPARFDRRAERDALGLAQDQVALLFPARLDPQKRPTFLLEILSRLRRRVPNGWVCLIAGDGPQRRLLELLIRWHGLTRHVKLLGAIPADGMARLYAASDALVLPTQDEGISLALFEAMSMGLPVIAADVGGQRELVTDDVGVLVTPSNIERDAYVSAFADLIQDPERRRRQGAAARHRIREHFELSATIDDLLVVLGRAIDLNRTTPRARLAPSEIQSAMLGVIDDVRHDRLQERLRGAPAVAPTSDGSRHPVREIVGWIKRHLLRPVYYWALRNGLDFVVPMASWMFRRLGWLLR